MSLASPVSPSHSWKVAHDPRNGRPAPARRPSAMRSSSSDHIITPAVTRFDPETADIPPSPTFARDDDDRAPSTPTPAPSADSLSVPPPPALVHRPATCPQRPSHPPPSATTTSPPPAAPTSLLARRRSSRSASARPDFFPKLDDLKLPALPAPPLEELDDTVVGEVIGVASQATTPFSVSPTSVRDVHEAPFRPTKTYASTPFPQGRRQSFFDSDDEGDAHEHSRESGNSDEDDDDDDDDDEDGRSTAESSVLDESTDGIRRFSLTDNEDKVST